MESKRRNFVVYGLLAGVWVLIAIWQAVDHARVQRLARAELIHSARDVSTTVATTIRAFRRWGGVISKERLESALNDLLRPGEWDGIVLLNEAGDVVASAGMHVNLQPKGVPQPAEVWTNGIVILMNPVALGTSVTRDLEGTNLPVILDFHRPAETNHVAAPREKTNDHESDAPREQRFHDDHTSPPPRREHNRRPPRLSRPPWWNDEEWKAILQKQGVHSFAIVMSTRNFQEASSRDLWLRAIIMALATISVVGSGIAWGNLAKTSDLQIRLVRASELNTHLKELNLAAAGLAHETRNPLNIIRGMAHMISKQPDAGPEVSERSRAIMDETDKVTAQLNEFINYSRPRQVRRSVLKLDSTVGEVVRALNYDLEEKKIHLEVGGEQLSIEADEQMLRQVLFNLAINAIQAVDVGGEIKIVAKRNDASEASIEIRDNGPGVPPERRTEIFKPYFTTQQKGTGLGLAIVQQIVLAHGWEIECLSNEPKGAIFRLTHLKLVAKA
jgi:signal transduction histidine kinase